jgi:D-3-phosphoglycerate dehydrogenase
MAFVVGLSAGFVRADGSPAFPDFDLASLARDPAIALRRLAARDGRIAAEDTAGLDALIQLGEAFSAESIAGDGRLKLVARFGVGVDRVDVGACTAAGIAVSITPEAVRRPVAVAIIALMLALACRLPEKDRLARLGPPGFARRSEAMGIGLQGRVLGSLGLGNIASEMFRLAVPFGMRFIAHDPYADPARAAALGVEMVELEALFARSDVLALNAPLTAATRGIVSAANLALMRRGAFLINTARGALVDQAALAAALREGRIAGAGLDVFDPEPPAPDDPILAAPNLIAAPHALAWTDQSFAAIGAACVEAIRAVRAGRPPVHLADPGVLEAPPRFLR